MRNSAPSFLQHQSLAVLATYRLEKIKKIL